MEAVLPVDSLEEDLVEAAEVRGKDFFKLPLEDDVKTDIISAFEGVVCMPLHVSNQQHGLVPGLT